MSGSFENASGKMRIVKDGRVVLDSNARSAELIPSAKVTVTGQTISFPDLWKGTCYRQYSGGTRGCTTYTAIVNQEWGPSEASPNTLVDVVLGTVPAGVDYIDVQVNVSRNVTPSLITTFDIAPLIPQGVWVELNGGGSCIVERYGSIVRMFEVILVGTNIVLRRKQSVSKDGFAVRASSSCQLNNATYFFSGTNAGYTSDKYTLGTKIDQKGPDAAANYRPARCSGMGGSDNPCSESHAGISYASTWYGDIVITPGRIGN